MMLTQQVNLLSDRLAFSLHEGVALGSAVAVVSFCCFSYVKLFEFPYWNQTMYLYLIWLQELYDCGCITFSPIQPAVQMYMYISLYVVQCLHAICLCLAYK